VTTSRGVVIPPVFLEAAVELACPSRRQSSEPLNIPRRRRFLVPALRRRPPRFCQHANQCVPVSHLILFSAYLKFIHGASHVLCPPSLGYVIRRGRTGCLAGGLLILLLSFSCCFIYVVHCFCPWRKSNSSRRSSLLRYQQDDMPVMSATHAMAGPSASASAARVTPSRRVCSLSVRAQAASTAESTGDIRDQAARRGKPHQQPPRPHSYPPYPPHPFTILSPPCGRRSSNISRTLIVTLLRTRPPVFILASCHQPFPLHSHTTALKSFPLTYIIISYIVWHPTCQASACPDICTPAQPQHSRAVLPSCRQFLNRRLNSDFLFEQPQFRSNLSFDLNLSSRIRGGGGTSLQVSARRGGYGALAAEQRSLCYSSNSNGLRV
jgi:hypothetical protein